MRIILSIICLFFTLNALATEAGDYLVKVSPQLKSQLVELNNFLPSQTKVEDLQFEDWIRIQSPHGQFNVFNVQTLSNHPDVLYIQPNYKVSLLEQPGLVGIQSLLNDLPLTPSATAEDNPEIPRQGSGGNGPDPLFENQWGMRDIGVKQALQTVHLKQEVVVAVIDTGVDYTHEDLIDNIWRNPGETGTDSQGRDKATNGVDDDENGYIDDLVGWDFVTNDNKPYDLAFTGFDILNGGNPGHGTHCAGNVGGRGQNGKGISGVFPNVKIMAVRFLSERGQGTTADAIKAIRYAVDNGADVLSNSWGSEGEDPDDKDGNRALRDAVQYSQDNNRLFIAAAGNGHGGVGYDNDADPNPGYPASYDHDIIVSVAAIDVDDQLGGFSNWGQQSVDLAAPGVNVFSTIPGNNYQDTIFDKFGITVHWDGTSMATPHVAGAAALYWAAYPDKSWREVKQALLNSAIPLSHLKQKLVSGGKLNVEALLNVQ